MISNSNSVKDADIFASSGMRGGGRFNLNLNFVKNINFDCPVDCEVVAEGKTVAAPVQKTTRALNTTTSR